LSLRSNITSELEIKHTTYTDPTDTDRSFQCLELYLNIAIQDQLHSKMYNKRVSFKNLFKKIIKEIKKT